MFLRLFCIVNIRGKMSKFLRVIGSSPMKTSSLKIKEFSSCASLLQQKKALVLGIYTEGKENPILQTTNTFKSYDKWLEGKLTKLLKLTKPIKSGSSRLYFGQTEKCPIVSVVSLGEKVPQNNNEGIDMRKENVRKGIAAGIRSLKDLGIENVEIDVSDDPISTAEGALLSAWSYKQSEKEKYPSDIKPLNGLPDDKTSFYDSDMMKKWEEGNIFAEGQNFARHLMESPANLMNPTIFSETVKDKLESCDSNGNIQVTIHDKEWIEDQKMGAFLSVAKGSSQPPKFLEIHYNGSLETSSNDPLVLVGKGVTFDSGGVSIKPSQGMEEMRADMGGAATVCSAILTAARLNVPGKVIGLIPLCENMVNGEATKPGDVVTAKDGTTIQVDNTDAEGRLILADALCYAREFNPAAILDVATLTGAMVVALGAGASGVFTNCDEIWTKLNKAGYSTGDRVWRMPLYQLYSDQVKPSHLADINNIGKGGRGGGACTAAAFLHHFIKTETKWAHLDIAGVMDNAKQEVPYLGPGMGGRPTRTLAEFIRRFNE